jgi:hypothetical protein
MKRSHLGDENTGWNRYGSKHNPKLECNTLVSEKRNTKVTIEKKNKNKNKNKQTKK